MSMPSMVDRTALAADSLISVRTIERAYQADPRIRERTWQRIRQSAMRLGLPIPPTPPSVKQAA
jgi:hypothetical protein